MEKATNFDELSQDGKIKIRTNNALGSRFSTRTQLSKDKETSKNDGFCLRIGKAIAVLVRQAHPAQAHPAQAYAAKLNKA